MLLWFSYIGFLPQALSQGHVGIGTVSPSAALHVADSSVVFTGPNVLPADPSSPPVMNAGVRLMWYPQKAAFRAGGVTSTQWNESSIGQYSGAFGYNNRAPGKYGFSAGNTNSASGDGAFAMGTDNLATGNYATAFGIDNEAQSYGSFVVGRYNIIAGSETEWINNDPLFVVGNGYVEDIGGVGTIVRRNALRITKGGTAHFDATVNVGNNLNVDGNAFLDHEITVGDTARFNGPLGIMTTDAIETALDVNGAIVFGDQNVNVDDNQTLIVGDRTYFWLGNFADGGTLHLSNGLKAGQLLIIENGSNNAFQLLDADVNLNLSGDRTLDKDDTIMLIWSAYGRWLEVNFTNN